MPDDPATSSPYCGHCGKQILRGCLFCSNCGLRHESAQTQSSEPVIWGGDHSFTTKQWLQVAGGFGVLFILICIVAFSGKPDHAVSVNAESSPWRPVVAAPIDVTPSPLQQPIPESKPAPFQPSIEPPSTTVPSPPESTPSVSMPNVEAKTVDSHGQHLADLRKRLEGVNISIAIESEVGRKLAREATALSTQPFPDREERQYLMDSMDKEKQTIARLVEEKNAIDGEIAAILAPPSSPSTVNKESSLPASDAQISANSKPSLDEKIQELTAERLQLTRKIKYAEAMRSAPSRAARTRIFCYSVQPAFLFPSLSYLGTVEDLERSYSQLEQSGNGPPGTLGIWRERLSTAYQNLAACQNGYQQIPAEQDIIDEAQARIAVIDQRLGQGHK